MSLAPHTVKQLETGLASADAALDIANRIAIGDVLPPLSNGQLYIGATGSAPIAAALTGGGNIFIVSSRGAISLTGVGAFTATNDSNIGLTVTAFSSTQSADLQQWQTSVGTPLVNITASGLLSVPAGTSTARARVGGVIFDHFVDASNTTSVQTDLYTDTLPANILTNNGDKIVASYCGTVTTTNTMTIRALFAGQVLVLAASFNPAAPPGSWSIDVLIVRTGSSTARARATFLSNAPTTPLTITTETDLTGLSFTGTNILKITGQGQGTGDIVAKLAFGEMKPAQ